MKILYVITCGDRGGAQVSLLDLIRHLPARFESVVVSGQDGFLRQGCEGAGIPFRKIRRLVREIHPLNDLIAMIQLVSLIHKERPDLVHAHTSKAGILARMAAWFTQTPSIFTAHTWSFDDGVPALLRSIAIPIEKLVALLGGPIITVSDANTVKAIRKSIAPEKQLVRIWVGIPDTVIRAQSNARGSVTMIMVARFVAQKDQKLLLRALSEVQGNWVLQLVGNGPLLAQTQVFAQELSLAGRVQFLGERQDVTELIAQADVFVLASKWEGLPRVILEAMRACLPVVATDIGGIREMVDDNVTGFLTKQGDLIQLRERIQTLMNSADLRIKMGAAARIRFEQDFQIEACVRKTAAIYDALYADSKRKSVITDEECA